MNDGCRRSPMDGHSDVACPRTGSRWTGVDRHESRMAAHGDREDPGTSHHLSCWQDGNRRDRPAQGRRRRTRLAHLECTRGFLRAVAVNRNGEGGRPWACRGAMTLMAMADDRRTTPLVAGCAEPRQGTRSSWHAAASLLGPSERQVRYGVVGNAGVMGH